MKDVLIEVQSTDVDTKTGPYKDPQRAGEKWTIIEQQARAQLPNGELRMITVQLDDRDPKPYPPGKYRLDYSAMVYVGRFGQLLFGKPVLVPA